MEAHIQGLLLGLELSASLKIATTVRKILLKIIQNPGSDRFRSISLKAFNQQTGGIPTGEDIMKVVGFEHRDDRLLFMDSLSQIHQHHDVIDSIILSLSTKQKELSSIILNNNHTAMIQKESNRQHQFEDVLALSNLIENNKTPLGDPQKLKNLPSHILERLHKLLRNIGENPSTDMYRTIRVQNVSVKELLEFNEAEAQLKLAGFTLFGDSLITTSNLNIIISCLKTVETSLSIQAAEEQQQFEDTADQMRQLRLKKPKPDPSEAPLGLLDPSIQEELTTAMQLVNDIQGLMEQDYLLRGAVGYEATYRKNGKKIFEEFKCHRSFKILHDLLDEWTLKVENTKRETKRTMFNTIHCPPDSETGKPHPATLING